MPIKEEVYDDQIKPLLDLITEVCEEHSIECVTAFELGRDLFGTTVLLSEKHMPPTRFKQAIDAEARDALKASEKGKKP